MDSTFSKILIIVILLLSVFSSLTGTAFAEEKKFELIGVSLGMKKEEIRLLFPEGLFQEAEDPKSGLTGLVYRVIINDYDAMVSFAFQENEQLVNMEIMVFRDEESGFYNFIQDVFTSRYGAPLVEDRTDEDTVNRVIQMIELLKQTTQDTDFMGWQGDLNTVAVISRDSYQTTYVEIRSISYYLC